MTKVQALARAYRYSLLVIVCLGIGMVSAISLLIISAFLIAGPDGGEWFSWAFSGSGYKFFAAILVFSAIAFPFVKRANLKIV